jgi:hypothetical protein
LLPRGFNERGGGERIESRNGYTNPFVNISDDGC